MGRLGDPAWWCCWLTGDSWPLGGQAAGRPLNSVLMAVPPMGGPQGGLWLPSPAPSERDSSRGPRVDEGINYKEPQKVS